MPTGRCGDLVLLVIKWSVVSESHWMMFMYPRGSSCSHLVQNRDYHFPQRPRCPALRKEGEKRPGEDWGNRTIRWRPEKLDHGVESIRVHRKHRKQARLALGLLETWSRAQPPKGPSTKFLQLFLDRQTAVHGRSRQPSGSLKPGFSGEGLGLEVRTNFVRASPYQSSNVAVSIGLASEG